MKRGEVELWQRVEAVFTHIAESPASQREAAVEKVCERDPELRRALESLLELDADFDSTTAAAGSRAHGREEHERDGVDGYRLVSRIGRGGTSTVFLAHRQTEGPTRRVALKILHHRRSRVVRRLFERERLLLARLDHPGIAVFLDSGRTHQGAPFIVMEYVEGVPITRYCDLRSAAVPARLELMDQVLDAVEYAHQHLVIHRDLKPRNILVTDAGRAKLLDFGIAKDLAADLTDRTATGDRLLTPTYASPEQLEGLPVTTASDIYTLGLLLARLLSGRLPPAAPPSGTVTSLTNDPEPPSRLLLHREAGGAGDLPPAKTVAALRGTTVRALTRALRGDLDAIVLRCLSPDPAKRYPSVVQLREDLRRHREGLPVSAQAPSLYRRILKAARRRPGAAVALALLALMAMSFLLLTLRHSRALSAERELAAAAERESEEVAAFLADTFRLADAVQREDLIEADGSEITLRQTLDLGAARVRRELGERPKLQAKLLKTMGEIYINLGETETALDLLRESLVLHREGSPDSGSETAETLASLGRGLAVAGELREAEGRLREALALLEGQLPPVREETYATCLAELGGVLLRSSEYPEAERHLRRSLAIRRRLAPDSRHLGETLTELGGLLWLQGELDEAEALLDEALTLYGALHPTGHPGIADALQNRAFIHAMHGERDAARASIERALEMRRRLQGDDHPETWNAFAASGEILFLARDFAGAEEVLRKVLALNRREEGSQHPERAIDLTSLAVSLLEQGKLAEAESLLRQATAISRQALGRESHAATSQAQALARVLLARGEPAEAIPLLRETLTFRLAHFGPDHRLVGITSTHLADALIPESGCSEALPLAREAVRIFEEADRREERRAAAAKGTLGFCIAAGGRPNQGRALLERSLRVLERELGPDSRESASMRKRLHEIASLAPP